MKNSFLIKFKLSNTKAKNRYYLLSKAILSVDGGKIEEFEKADIQMKTIMLSVTGKLKESMSFPQIKYQQIVKEEWESSDFFENITKRFFFVIFQKDLTGKSCSKKSNVLEYALE